MWRELTDRHREIYDDPTIGGPDPGEHFDRHLARVGSERIWVAVSGGQVVGLAGLVLKDGEAELEPLVVHHAFRRHGIGTRLIEAVVAAAREAGVRYLNVRPVGRNIEGVRFFYRRGFRALGHVELFIDLSEPERRVWRPGPRIFGCQLDF